MRPCSLSLRSSGIHSKYAKSRGCLLLQRFVVWLSMRSDSVDFRRVNRWQARTEQHAPKGQLMTSSLRTGQGKVRSTFGTSTESLFQEPFRPRYPGTREQCLKPPSGTSRGLDGNPDRTKCHHRIACELRTHRRDTSIGLYCQRQQQSSRTTAPLPPQRWGNAKGYDGLQRH